MEFVLWVIKHLRGALIRRMLFRLAHFIEYFENTVDWEPSFPWERYAASFNLVLLTDSEPRKEVAAV